MSFDFYLGKYFLDFTCFVNDESGADNSHKGFSVELLFLPNPVFLHYLFVDVGNESEG